MFNIIFPLVLLFWGFVISIFLCFPFISKGYIYLYGAFGEWRALSALKKELPDSYHIFANVKIHENMEADLVVVGPSGVYDVEVKNYKGRIEGDAESKGWTLHKIGRNGGVYEKGIKNPLGQLKRNIYILSKYLRIKGSPAWVNGVVFFVNENASFSHEVLNQRECFMDAGSLGDEIRKNERCPSLSERQINEICEVLEPCISGKPAMRKVDFERETSRS